MARYMETPIDELTRAERDVLVTVLAGRTNCYIALARGTSEKTVANQVSQILRKSGSSSRRELRARLRSHPPCCEKLTAREREVFTNAVSGKSNKLIAFELGVTVSTVGVLYSRAARKAGAAAEATSETKEPLHGTSGHVPPSSVAQ